MRTNFVDYELRGCRMCGSGRFRQVLDMGEQPAVNSLVEASELEQTDQTYRLIVSRCEGCSLVQIVEPISADKIYREEDYLYFSGDMPGLKEYFKAYAKELTREFLPKEGDFVVEIGSNDGLMLDQFTNKDLVLGVDPATNVAIRAFSKGIPTISDYFTERVARSIKREFGPAKLIYGNNCIAHIDDLDNVMRGVTTLLTPDGVFAVECNYWGGMVKNLNYGLIYHDHFSYFSLFTWVQYARKFGMEVFDADVTPAQGGSLRVFMCRGGKFSDGPYGSLYKMSRRMKDIGDEEYASKLNSYEVAAQYGFSVKQKAKQLHDEVHTLKGKGKKIAGYGAAAKGFSILSLAGIDNPDIIEYFVDDSPAKQGKWAPVSRIPVYSRADAVKKGLPDVFIITAPNYADIIKEKERSLGFKGDFIVP